MQFFFASNLSINLSVVVCARLPRGRKIEDTAGTWTEKYVNRLSDAGIIAVAADGRFNPDKPLPAPVSGLAGEGAGLCKINKSYDWHSGR